MATWVFPSLNKCNGACVWWLPEALHIPCSRVGGNAQPLYPIRQKEGPSGNTSPTLYTTLAQYRGNRLAFICPGLQPGLRALHAARATRHARHPAFNAKRAACDTHCLMVDV